VSEGERRRPEDDADDESGATTSPSPDGGTGVHVGAGGRHDGHSTDADGPTPDRSRRAPGGVSVSTLFEVLGNERRRHAIQVLRDREEPVTLSALSEAVAARENDRAPEELTRDQRKRTYTALQQTHLPKMDDADVLTFDKAAGEVRPGDAIVEYTLYLDVVPSMGVRRSEVYLAVAAVACLVTVGVWAGLPPFTLLDPLTWAALVVTGVAVVAVVQLSQHPLFPERFWRR
jgi:hypothetical protein